MSWNLDADAVVEYFTDLGDRLTRLSGAAAAKEFIDIARNLVTDLLKEIPLEFHDLLNEQEAVLLGFPDLLPRFTKLLDLVRKGFVTLSIPNFQSGVNIFLSDLGIKTVSSFASTLPVELATNLLKAFTEKFVNFGFHLGTGISNIDQITHNWMLFPSDKEALSFDYEVTDLGSASALHVIAEATGTTPGLIRILKAIPLSQGALVHAVVEIPQDLRGKVGKLTFRVVPSANVGTVGVTIDNVQLVDTITLNIPSQNNGDALESRPADVQQIVNDSSAVLAVAQDSWVQTVIGAFPSVTLVPTSLPETILSVVSREPIGHINLLIDTDAAGHGWFIDPIPQDNEEFVIGGNPWELKAKPGSNAEGKIDLLTVLTHELGHVLGLEDIDPSVSPSQLMTGTLPAGMRRLPSPLDIAALNLLVGDTVSSPSTTAMATASVTVPSALSESPLLVSGLTNGQGMLTESTLDQSRILQSLTLPSNANTLHFELPSIHLMAGLGVPPDAFEVALLDAQTKASLVGTARGLTLTDALLNIQSDGHVYFGQGVQVFGAVNSGDVISLSAPIVVDVDLTGIETGRSANLYFDLLGFGAADSSVAIDNVEVVTEGTQPFIARDDTAETDEDSSVVINVVANDTDDNGIIDPTTVTITTPPSNGSVQVNSVTGAVTYTPANNFFGADSFRYTVRDNVGLTSNEAQVQVQVAAVNDAPAGTNTTVTTLEDTAYTFTAADFGFHDPADSPAHALTAVQITTLATDGVLTLSGLPVAINQVIPVASLNAGDFKFSPDLNEHGSLYATFTFQVQDNGGMANGGVDLDPTPQTMTVTVTPVNDAPLLGAITAPSPVQYSDPITPVLVTASDVDTSGTALIPSFSYRSNGGNALAGLPSGLSAAIDTTTVGLPGQRTWTISGTANVAPGTYTITAQVSDGNLDSPQQSFVLAVNREDADVTYTGQTFVNTASPTSNTAVVPLEAVIRDITAVSASGDLYAGAILNAAVTFKVYDAFSNALLATITNPIVGLISSDPRIALAQASFTANLGNASAATYRVRTLVSGSYMADAIEDDSLITVAKPVDFTINGGGYVVVSTSDGSFKADAARKVNFGLNIGYNKNLTNVQGKVTAIFRRTQADGVHTYQIKSNASGALSVDPTTGVATFTAKANLTDVTNEASPVTIGNYDLLLRVDDNGEPSTGSNTRGNDQFSLRLMHGTTLLFATRWDGTQVQFQTLDGGNIQVRPYNETLLTVHDQTVTEGNTGTTNAAFTVSLNAVSTKPVSFTYATANDTATAGSDYLAASRTAGIPVGQTSATITVKVNPDTIDEPDERFFLNLLTATNAGIQDPTGVGLLVDDDPAPPLQLADAANATGQIPNGAPFVTVPLPCDVLAPGESVNVVLTFSNPTRTQFTFNSSVLAVGETAPAGRLTGRNADHEHPERRSSNRSESQYEQTPSPSLPPPIPSFPRQGGRGNTCPVC